MGGRTWVAVVMALAVLSSCASDPQEKASAPEIGLDVPVTAVDFQDPRGRNSAMLAADPTDPNFVALANRIDGSRVHETFFGCELNLSVDGGRSWLPAQPVPKLPPGAEKCYGPEIAFDSSGTLYYLFVGLHTLGNTVMGVYLTKSEDQGRTFSEPKHLFGDHRFMVRMAIHQSGPHKDRIQIVWLEPSDAPGLGALSTPPNPLMAMYSDNAGETFSKPVQLSDPKRSLIVGPALALGPDGAVHVAYYDLQSDQRDYYGLEGPVWEGPWSVVVSTSTNGGKYFTRHVEVEDQVKPPERLMLIFTTPPPALAAGPKGVVYAGWTDARNNDRDVFISISNDKAKTFDDSRRLNDDEKGNGKDQYLPRFSAAQDGRFEAIFFDRRADQQNQRDDVYYTLSRDQGKTFLPNKAITPRNMNTFTGASYAVASADGLVERGARLGLLQSKSKTIAAWTDTRLPPVGGVSQNVFTAELRFGKQKAEKARRSGRAFPGSSQTVEVEAKEYEFIHVPEAQSGRIVFVLRNKGELKHDLSIIPLAGRPDGYIPNADELSNVSRTAIAPRTPGEREAVAADLAPGRYALICSVTDEDKRAHAAKGMRSELVVTERVG